ncbi:capsule biosynthesis protein [Rhodobacter sp. CZR27]|uniref:capsule biosynthesis protein n=1 Tax=Rhodobacter sp. CZR27 TaxID=2033869 RepID=UPI000BBE8CF9|nr:capsular biosynthesis protein [Rhodobacter sp. CZR27]
MAGASRRFLFLQGPHGPFFWSLGRRIRAAGADVLRVGFNFGDRAFWPERTGFIPFRGSPADWPATFHDILRARGITDLVLYGDTRPVHAQAIAIARAEGLTVHVFEEGYLRPSWVTYERGGANGHSRLMELTVPMMRQALGPREPDLQEAPARWGDMTQHMIWGALYHGLVMAGGRAYPGFRPHRTLSVPQEFRLHLRRLALLPLHRLERMAATARILLGSFPYHLVLLQLEHDSSFTMHSPYTSMAEFIEEVTRAFAEGAPPHHHLVFKAHPLEDGRAPLASRIRQSARRHGLNGRVHFVRGGKLARLLAEARSAVTVNSTAGQQALWRGLPVRTLGTSVYSKPGLVSSQPLAGFFARPEPPDRGAYRAYRSFLLATSQVPGGFYSMRGRRRLLRTILDMMLDPQDPYATPGVAPAILRQQLHIHSAMR